MCGFAEIFLGAGAVSGGIQSAQRGRAEARHYERLGDSLKAAALHAAARTSERNDQGLGLQQAQAAASGVGLEGSLLDALLSRNYFARVEEEDIRLQGLQQQAGQYAQAEFSRADTRAALTGPAFGAATSLLKSAETKWPDAFPFFA